MHKAKALSSIFRTAVKKSSGKDIKPITSFNKSKKSVAKEVSLPTLNLNEPSNLDDSTQQLAQEISSILCGASDEKKTSEEKSLDKVLEIPWFSNMTNKYIALRRKEKNRERKLKYIFKTSQVHRFERLVKMCGQKLGPDATLQVFGKLGREAGVKEYNALIGLCIEEARKTKDDKVSLQNIHHAFQLFKSMTEHGLKLEEETYGPLLLYFIDMGMIEEFQYFCGVVKGENPSSLVRLGYYEMLLWTRVNDEEKIQELCSSIAAYDEGDKSSIGVNYILALSEADRKKELLKLLEVIDITKVDYVTVMSIFKSLGRLALESFAKNFMFVCKTCDYGADKFSKFILNYVISIPNLAAEDIIVKFKYFHEELEVTPTLVSYEKLIAHFSSLHKVHAALVIVNEVFESGMPLKIEMLHTILQASEKSCEYNLVRRIYSMIRQHNLMPNKETFRIMISLSVKMKDFEGAFNMLNDVQELNMEPTVNMYNAIIAGYFREKNVKGALMVLKQMERANIPPDSQTFSYLISNCNSEEHIIKHYEVLKNSGVQVTKHILMALINAYANCGLFDKAKQVVSINEMPANSSNEYKNVLVSALASNKQVSDALDIYEEIKKSGGNLESKAIISLIEYLQSEGELGRLLQLLNELDDPEYWVDGCCRIISYCVRYRELSSAIDLLKQLKDKLYHGGLALEPVIDQAFAQIADGEVEKIDIQFGLDLLGAIKEDLGLRPTRKSLDFLLATCVNAKDSHSAHLIWKEYKATGLPYNVLSFLRMYQALLASGDLKSANDMLKRIPKDDPHVRCVINACQITYKDSPGKGEKKKISQKRGNKTE